MKLLFIILALALPGVSIACSCEYADKDTKFEDFKSLVSSFRSADSVVLAHALSESTTEGFQTTTFVVETTWKGDHANKFQTNVATSCCMCGYHFNEGESYLLYLWKYSGGKYYYTSSCSRTKKKSNAKDEIDTLNRIMPNKGSHAD